MPYSGDDCLKVLDLTAEGAPQKYDAMLADYHRLLEARRSLPDYRSMTPVEVRERLDDVRWRLKRAVGFIEYEDHSPPEFHPTGEVRRRGYVVRKGWFEPRPGWPVPALLYLPEPLEGKAPAVLAVHGHAVIEGKLQAAVQKRCVGLASRGFVVLAVDASGHGERRPSGHANFEIFAAGMSPQALLVHDNMRALDLLVSLPFVDPDRIGMTGSSGGGNQTMYTAALDDRVAAAVPAASVCAFEDHMAHSSSDYCPCEAVPGMVRWADIGDFLALIAPRPVLILSGTRDATFPVKGARESFLRARDAYEALGAGGNIEMREVYAPHSYARSMREEMYAFFERVLMGREDSRPEEHPIPVEPPEEETLRVFAVGEFPRDAETLEGFVWKRARAILDAPSHPAASVRDAETLEAFRREVLAGAEALFGDGPEETFRPRLVGRFHREWGRYEADAFLVETERGVFVPGVILSGTGEPPGDRPLAVALSRGGKDDAMWARPVLDLADAGFAVLGLDVRGTGETCYVWQGEEDRAALNAVITGRSLFAGRAEDVAAVLRVLKAEGMVPEGMRTAVWTRDAFSMFGVWAAVISPDVDRVIVERGLLSLAWPDGMGALKAPGLFTPGILRLCDMQHMMGLLCPKPLLVINPVGGDGRALSPGEADGASRWLRDVYGAISPGGLAVLAEVPAEKRDALVSAFLGGGIPDGGAARGEGP